MNKRQRNSAVDIIRIVAFFCVVSVHFVLYSGFYNTPLLGKRMYIMQVMRTGFIICVPLFLILTGYLMGGKKLSRKFYGGIKKTLGVYLIAFVFCILFKVLYYKEAWTLKNSLEAIFSYTSANHYAWYIEMYIGLFLLIPFLNLTYSSLQTKRHKQVLVATFILLTSAPAVINALFPLLPDWWSGVYPITYYFIGVYLREYPPVIKKRYVFCLFLASILLFGSGFFLINRGELFSWSSYQDYGSLTTLVTAVTLFVFLLKIDVSSAPKGVKTLLMKISDLCLGAYLVSYIFDSYFYTKLNAEVTAVPERFKYYFLVVPVIFLCSLALSYVVNLIYKLICFICSQLVKITSKEERGCSKMHRTHKV